MVVPILGELVGRWSWYLVTYDKRTRCQELSSRGDLKRTLAHGHATLEVVGELGNIKQLRPISLVGTHVVLQIKLQESIDSLDLSITLRIENGGKIELGTHELEQLRPKTPCETSVPIASNVSWQAPVLHHVLEQAGSLLSGTFLVFENENSILEVRNTGPLP